MVLKFFGRGSGFADDHTSAYFFTENKEMVIIDCPVSTLQKVKKMNLDEYKEIYVLITHTHGDHVGGLGLLVQYAYFILKKPIHIVAPTTDVVWDINTLLWIEGNDESWYTCTSANVLRKNLDKKWIGASILTEHSPQLKGKCFGYQLNHDGKNIIYTGDTASLDPFLPYLDDESILYVDTSVYYGVIHLKLKDALDDFIKLINQGVEIYLMHLDDIAAAEKIVANYPNIKIVTLE